MKSAGMVTFAVILIVLVIAFGPHVLIWAINTLFGTAIEVTLKTWFAALILMLFVSTGSAK